MNIFAKIRHLYQPPGTMFGIHKKTLASHVLPSRHCPPLTDEERLGDAGDGDGVGDAVPLAAAPRRHDLVRRRHQRPRLLQRRGVHIGYCYSMLRSVSQNTQDEGRNTSTVSSCTPLGGYTGQGDGRPEGGHGVLAPEGHHRYRYIDIQDISLYGYICRYIYA